MTHTRERRKQLANLERTGWRLWTLGDVIIAALAVGLGLLIYPVLHHCLELFALPFGTPPDLILALLILLALSEVYVVAKRRELSARRNLIVASCMPAPVAQKDLPRESFAGATDCSALPDILNQDSARATRNHHILAIALLGIREVSQFNEREGHRAGGLILNELAQALEGTVRRTDTVLRYGPDQVLCLLPGTTREGGAAFVRRILKTCDGISQLRDVTLESRIGVLERGAEIQAVMAEAKRDLEVKQKNAVPLRAASTSLT